MAISGAKRVKLYRWDADAKDWIKWDGVLDAGDLQIGGVEIKDATTSARAVVGTTGLEVFDQVANSLVPSVYDYVALSYTGSNLTETVFKTGGAGGTAVSTLTLAYTGSVLDSVTKT